MSYDHELCSDCRFNDEGFCTVHMQQINTDSKPCDDFEER